MVKKRPRDNDLSDLQALVNGLNNGSATDKERYAFDNVDLPVLMSHYAVEVAVFDMDSKHKNYFVYRDTYGDGEWRMFGWDKDLSMGHVWDQGATSLVWNVYWGSANKMHALLFDVPVFSQMFKRRARTVVDRILQAPDSPATDFFYENRINALHDALKPLADADRAKYGWPTNLIGYYHYPDLTFDEGIHELTNDYFRPRRTFVYNTYSWWLPSAQPAGAALRFNTLDVSPISANQDEEYIELTNANNYAVDISGWRLSNAVDFVFREGVVVAPGRTVYASPNVNAFRARTTSPKRGESRFVQGPYRGHLSARGETIYLLNTSGAIVASTNYPANVSPAQDNLRVTEIMYHPRKPTSGPYNAEDFEFIELMNIGAAPLDIANCKFSEGISFVFTGILASSECIVLVRNLEAFATRYNTNSMLIGGTYSGALDNNGETLKSDDARNETIQSFRYSDAWHPPTDGKGSSLEIIDPYGSLDLWSVSNGWRASVQYDGTPGYVVPEPSLFLAGVLLWLSRRLSCHGV